MPYKTSTNERPLKHKKTFQQYLNCMAYHEAIFVVLTEHMSFRNVSYTGYITRNIPFIFADVGYRPTLIISFWAIPLTAG